MKNRPLLTSLSLLVATSCLAAAAPALVRCADRPCCQADSDGGRPCAFVPDVLPNFDRAEGTTQLELLRQQLSAATMATQVYRSLGETCALPPFQNIPEAEDQHAAGLRALLVVAHVDLPPVGTLIDPALIVQRDALIARGRIDEISALRVGIQIEEANLADLHVTMAATTDAATPVVLRALEAGSRHHPNAFVRHLARRGIIYEPASNSTPPPDSPTIL